MNLNIYMIFKILSRPVVCAHFQGLETNIYFYKLLTIQVYSNHINTGKSAVFDFDESRHHAHDSNDHARHLRSRLAAYLRGDSLEFI